MNKIIKYKWIHFVFLSLFSVVLTSCAIGLPRHWPEKTGRVLDVHTKKPVKDAYLIVKWKGYGGWVGIRTICYHVESSKTNENGQFVIPEFNENFTDGSLSSRHASIYLYAPNYIESEYRRSNHHYKQKTYFLEEFKGTRKKRLDFLSSGVACRNAGSSKKKLLAANIAMYKEAKSLYEKNKSLVPKTKEEKKIFFFMKLRLASLIDDSHRKYTGIKKEKKIEEILKNYDQELLELSE